MRTSNYMCTRSTYIDEIEDERELEGSVQSNVIILEDFIQTALGTEHKAHTDVGRRGTRPQELVHILVAELPHLPNPSRRKETNKK